MSATMWGIIGIAVTMAVAGASFWFQGKALQNPSNTHKLGSQLIGLGILWVMLAVFYIALAFLFKPA
ncbi:MAG: hypothetical protein WC169_00950 [Dehalococcoidia bacterium]|jgi:hypothetical protein